MNWREFKQAVEDQAVMLGIDPDDYEVCEFKSGRQFDLDPDVDIHTQRIWVE